MHLNKCYSQSYLLYGKILVLELHKQLHNIIIFHNAETEYGNLESANSANTTQHSYLEDPDANHVALLITTVAIYTYISIMNIQQDY